MTRHAQELARRLADAGVTQTRIAADLGVSQSQVSRLLAGEIKRRSKLFERLCAYVEAMPGFERPEAPIAEIYAAINDTWDGTIEHARALAHVIRAVAILRNLPARKKGP